MFIDEKTEKVLGIDEVWNELDVASPFGLALRAQRKYYSKKEELEREYAELKKFIETDNVKIECTQQFLSSLRDIKGTIEKLIGGEVLDELDLFEIKYFLYYHQKIANEWPTKLGSLQAAWKILDIAGKGNYDFYIEDAYSKSLEKLRKKIVSLENEKGKLTQQFFKKVNLPNEEKIVVSKNDGAMLKRLANVGEAKKVKETFGSILFEFEKPKGVQKIELEIDKLVLEKNKEKYEVMKRISLELKKYSKQLKAELGELGYLDLVIAKALFCKRLGCKKPEIKGMLKIEKGRNYLLEKDIQKDGRAYTPLSISIKNGVSVISGSNMAGKTQTLKTIGQLASMAHMGLFVPAQKFEFAPLDYVFFSAEDPDGDSNFSTFAKEILRVNSALGMAGEQGLILIDEIARGTNHTEAQALSKAIIGELKSKNSFSIITTHLPGLLNIESVNYYQMVGLKNADYKKIREELKGKNGCIGIIYDHMSYEIEEGSKSIPLDALKIAEMIGLKEEVLREAKRNLEKSKPM